MSIISTENNLQCFSLKRYFSSIRLSASALNRNSHSLSGRQRKDSNENININHSSVNRKLTKHYFECFHGDGCFCLGHLLMSSELMTNSAFVKNTEDDLIYLPILW